MNQVVNANSETRRQPGLGLLGLLFALGFPTYLLSRLQNEFADVRHFILYEIVWWTAVAAVILYVLFAEKRLLFSVGYRRIGAPDFGVGIAGGMLLLAGLTFIFFVVFPFLHLREAPEAAKLLTMPFWWRVLLVVRGVFAEELFYRGYAIERLQELTRSRAFAGILSCAVFTYAHLGSWGWSHLLIAGFAGVVLTLLYLWRRNLWVTMTSHFVVDAVGVLAA